ncbi:MAG: glutaredoxin domain-containing protein [Dehalococcoidales bacterium]|nr:glutaredoxin domain-containing protein [Dehalococcoidales bacterium]
MADKICVYGTKWCHDTVRARDCLARLGIDYTWFDVDEDENASAYVRQVNKGNRSVPTIVFPDGSILVEPSEAELEAKCKK